MSDTHDTPEDPAEAAEGGPRAQAAEAEAAEQAVAAESEPFDPVAAHPEVAELGYEQARDELADVVKRLEAGGLSLEDSLALWERGEALATVCERHLAGAQERVDQALQSVQEDGSE
ncbi:hypothetical protein GCM10027174_02120 [Salinifilum aidingensis]